MLFLNMKIDLCDFAVSFAISVCLVIVNETASANETADEIASVNDIASVQDFANVERWNAAKIGDRKKHLLLPWLCLILRKRVGRRAQTVESVHVGRWIEEGRDILVFKSRERGLCDVSRKVCHKKMQSDHVPTGDGRIDECGRLRLDI